MEEKMFLCHAQTLWESRPQSQHLHFRSKGQITAPPAAPGESDWGVLSGAVPGSPRDTANTPQVTGSQRPHTSTSTPITVTLLQHPTERSSKALHSMQALTFDNKTQTALRLSFLDRIPSIIFFGYSTFCCFLVWKVLSWLWAVYQFTDLCSSAATGTYSSSFVFALLLLPPKSTNLLWLTVVRAYWLPKKGTLHLVLNSVH